MSAGMETDGARTGKWVIFYLEELRDVIWVYAPEMLAEAFHGAYYE